MFAADCTRSEGGKAAFVSARSFEAEKVIAQIGIIGDIAACHIGDGGALILVNAYDRRCSPETHRSGRLFVFHDGLYDPDSRFDAPGYALHDGYFSLFLYIPVSLGEFKIVVNVCV